MTDVRPIVTLYTVLRSSARRTIGFGAIDSNNETIQVAGQSSLFLKL